MSIDAWMSLQRTCPWQTTRDVPELLPREIHLCWVPLAGTEADLIALRAVLSDAERQRAERYRFDRHRKAYIFGRGSLRLLLDRYTGESARRISFRYGPHGKPALANGCGSHRISFNYSDADGYALYGFALDSELGVDLENLNREVGFERIVERKFTQAEADAILGLPLNMRKAAFLACWTRKEGYGKARGWGINYPLDSVELCADCGVDRVRLEAGEGPVANWTIRQIYPSREFVGTLVHPTVEGAEETLRLRYIGITPARLLRTWSSP